MRRRYQVLLLASSAAFLACRTTASQTAATVKDATGAKPAPVIALIGGFNSCDRVGNDPISPYGTGLWIKGKPIIDAFTAATGLTPKVLLTCYGITGTSPSAAIDFRYALPPAAYQIMPVSNVVAPLTMQQLGPVLDKIQQQLTAFANGGPIYVVGHSFGGWTSMQTALRLAANPKGVTTLVTIDPISPLNCNPSTYLSAWGLGENPGCKQAPADIASAQRQTIKGNSGRWQHFYQTQFSILHSSRIPELTEGSTSYRIDLPTITQVAPNNYHGAIAVAPRIWYYVDAALRMDYGLPAPPVPTASSSLALDDAAAPASPDGGTTDSPGVTGASGDSGASVDSGASGDSDANGDGSSAPMPDDYPTPSPLPSDWLVLFEPA